MIVSDFFRSSSFNIVVHRATSLVVGNFIFAIAIAAGDGEAHIEAPVETIDGESSAPVEDSDPEGCIDFTDMRDILGGYQMTLTGELGNLETSWEERRPGLEAKMEALREEISGVEAELSTLQLENDKIHSDIDKCENFMDWIETRMEENDAKIDKMYAERCKTHQKFIEHLKEMRLTFRLLDFIQ